MQYGMTLIVVVGLITGVVHVKNEVYDLYQQNVTCEILKSQSKSSKDCKYGK